MKIQYLLPLIGTFIDLAHAADLRSESGIVTSPIVGEPHGDTFDDAFAIGGSGLHRRIASVTMGCVPGEHVYSISLTYRDKDDRTPGVTVVHGGTPPPRGRIDYQHMDLAKDESIFQVYLTTWRKKTFRSHRTRIGFIRLATNKKQALECGVKDSAGSSLHDMKDQTLIAIDPPYNLGNDKSALLYFSGSSGDAIDALQAHWIPVTQF